MCDRASARLGCRGPKPPVEAFNPSARIHDLLLSGIKRVALRADFKVQV